MVNSGVTLPALGRTYQYIPCLDLPEAAAQLEHAEDAHEAHGAEDARAAQAVAAQVAFESKV